MEVEMREKKSKRTEVEIPQKKKKTRNGKLHSRRMIGYSCSREKNKRHILQW
jgi:hypothetical protein